jgi:hypothetical protein
MTLLEVLLATFILATVVSMVTMSLSGSLDVIEATDQQGQVYHRAQVALQRISEDLASALLVEGEEFSGSSEVAGGSDSPLLTFTSTAHVVFDPEHDVPGIARISYTVVPDTDNEGELLLLRSDERIVQVNDANDRQEDAAYLLCDRLRAVRFSYLDDKGEEADSWTTESDNTFNPPPRKLPVAISCTLDLWLDRQKEQSLEFTTSVLIPVGLINEDDSSGS